MSSQNDLDQGGTQRLLQRQYMGPSIGWVETPYTSVLNVTGVGTSVVQRSTTLILVSVNANGVILQLPSALQSNAGAIGVPGLSIPTPITIVDLGGFAGSHPIVINPKSGELIDGLASISLTTPFGAFVLRPNVTQPGWTLIQ
jgi:hypothetical protein